MCAIVLRRLQPGTYEEFRRAWEPISPANWPAGFLRSWLARSDEDPNVVATFAMFDLDHGGLDQLRDSEWMHGEVERLGHVAEFEERLLFSGYFEIVEEILPPRDWHQEQQ
jgi:hypothetical protein